MRPIFLALACLGLILPATASDTTITYQGQLQDAAGPVTDTHDMAFRLFDSESGTGQIGSEVNFAAVSVQNGLFQVDLDFGSEAFAEVPRYLEVEVAGTVLDPRQRIAAAPIALNVLNLPETDDTLDELECASGQIAKFDGSAWACAADEDTTYSAGTGLTLTGTTMSLDTSHVNGRYWRRGGNTGTSVFGNFIGTNDDSPFEIRIDGDHAMRFESASFGRTNVIGGHRDNEVADGVHGATISGGGRSGSTSNNAITENFGTIGGGEGHRLESSYSTIGGGRSNTVTGGTGTVIAQTVGGGWGNTASGNDAVVSGGRDNTAGSSASAIGGGRDNEAAGIGSVVAGGIDNTASGSYSSVPGGRNNVAAGSYSLAAGRRAKAENTGTFVWADSTNVDFASTGNNQFLIRASGGVGIGTNAPTRMLHMKGNTSLTPTMLFESENAPEDRRVAALFMNVTTGHMSIGRMTDDATSLASTHFQIRSDDGYVGIARSGDSISHPLHMASGAHVTAGGTWTNSSDADAITAFHPVNPDEILTGVVQMPITYWEYKNDQGVRHLGPTAQDFAAAFQLGNGDKTISTIDANGVALAAIQGLYGQLEQKQQQIETLEARQTALETENAELRHLAEGNAKLEDRLAALEALLIDHGQMAEVSP